MFFSIFLFSCLPSANLEVPLLPVQNAYTFEFEDWSEITFIELTLNDLIMNQTALFELRSDPKAPYSLLNFYNQLQTNSDAVRQAKDVQHDHFLSKWGKQNSTQRYSDRNLNYFQTHLITLSEDSLVIPLSTKALIAVDPHLPTFMLEQLLYFLSNLEFDLALILVQDDDIPKDRIIPNISQLRINRYDEAMVVVTEDVPAVQSNPYCVGVWPSSEKPILEFMKLFDEGLRLSAPIYQTFLLDKNVREHQVPAISETIQSAQEQLAPLNPMAVIPIPLSIQPTKIQDPPSNDHCFEIYYNKKPRSPEENILETEDSRDSREWWPFLK